MLRHRFTSTRTSSREDGYYDSSPAAGIALAFGLAVLILIMMLLVVGFVNGDDADTQAPEAAPEVEETDSILELQAIVASIEENSADAEPTDRITYTLQVSEPHSTYTTYGVNGEEPTYEAYCFSVVLGDESAFYYSPTQEYRNGDADTVFECSGWA